jgi:hypothetical protein
LFGPNGLDRIEALEAVDLAKRAATAKVIDAIEVEPEPAEPEPTEAEADEIEAADVMPPQGEPDPEMLGDEF